VRNCRNGPVSGCGAEAAAIPPYARAVLGAIPTLAGEDHRLVADAGSCRACRRFRGLSFNPAARSRSIAAAVERPVPITHGTRPCCHLYNPRPLKSSGRALHDPGARHRRQNLRRLFTSRNPVPTTGAEGRAHWSFSQSGPNGVHLRYQKGANVFCAGYCESVSVKPPSAPQWRSDCFAAEFGRSS